MAAFNPFRYFDEVRREVKKVTWPTKQETRVSTIMVLIMVIIASFFLFVTDQVINSLVKLILGV